MTYHYANGIPLPKHTKINPKTEGQGPLRKRKTYLPSAVNQVSTYRLRRQAVLVALALLIYLSPTHAAGDTAQPIQIGQAIPEAVWNLPLQVVDHPEGKGTITLADHRGKFILLDFWGTFCSSCIQAMPGIHDVQQEFDSEMVVLPVSWSAPEATAKALREHPLIRSLGLSSVVEARALIDRFPHGAVPHYVWINPEGVVVATTAAKDITADNVSRVLRGEEPMYALKANIDSEKPILFDADKLPLGAELGGYALFVSGEMPGLGSGTRFRKVDGVKVGVAMFNRDLKAMLATVAWEMRGIHPRDRMIELDTIADQRPLTVDFIVPPSRAADLYPLLLDFLDAQTGYRARWVMRDGTEFFEISRSDNPSKKHR